MTSIRNNWGTYLVLSKLKIRIRIFSETFYLFLIFNLVIGIEIVGFCQKSKNFPVEIIERESLLLYITFANDNEVQLLLSS